jgi:hypothetical protein
MQSECDPHIWSQVEELMRDRMTLESANLERIPETLQWSAISTEPTKDDVAQKIADQRKFQ